MCKIPAVGDTANFCQPAERGGGGGGGGARPRLGCEMCQKGKISLGNHGQQLARTSPTPAQHAKQAINLVLRWTNRDKDKGECF